MELEDDAYFADLSKQISLLIMDEDEDPLTSCHPHSLQCLNGAMNPPAEKNILVYEQQQQHVCFRSEISKGTGVFIPQSTQPRRKRRKGRSSSHQKHSQHSNFKPINNNG